MEGLRISYVSLPYAPDFSVSDTTTLADECFDNQETGGQERTALLLAILQTTPTDVYLFLPEPISQPTLKPLDKVE